MTGHGHVCPKCEGRGIVRQRTANATVRIPCPECGGSGALTPGPRERNR